ncbi:SWIM zinc finger family protein [Roseisolibacter agri]|uniref:SWIM-type domain-containing protein n=1 Tax=Roseisolibacter agri TaxID=2014610 RepID=A0AA37Q200_9BACT|nr:SWIM zinc finger family protein [Roseisolibacter agri]GLC24909.1 hypothetical protein rosag_14220 [Roseisolibacter agri]
MSATPLSTDQVLSLAPDAPSAKAGAALAVARKWTGVGGDGEGRVVWGLCQGSGAQPYRTQVDLADVASRCSCPSRKFPCKHALGLLLLLVHEPELFAVGEPPAWVAEWLAERAGRTERKRQREAAAPVADDAASGAAVEKARERRTTARANKVAAGLVELARWLEDLTRGGLAASASRPVKFWETAAARLVDAQAPGAARLVRQLATIPSTGADWPERMVAAVARLHLLTEAYARLPELPEPLQADVRATLGWATTEDADDARTITDEWTVLGQVVEEEERLRARRTWLAGRRTGRHALLLHFAHGAAPFAEPVPPAGGTMAAELAFLPGSAPLRATVRTLGAPAPDDAAVLPAGHARIAGAMGDWAATLAANPWTERVALVLSAAVPEPDGERWRVRDADGDVLPLAPRFHAGWPLLALSGGHPVWIAGEWDGDALLPLSASDGGRLLSLTQPVAHSVGAPA